MRTSIDVISKIPHQFIYMKSLPTDVIFEILACADDKSLVHLVTTCHRLRSLVSVNDRFWSFRLSSVVNSERPCPLGLVRPGSRFLRVGTRDRCYNCHETGTKQHLFYSFIVCSTCDLTHFQCVTKKTAVKDFFLKDPQLETLETREESKPRSVLYLVSDVINLARQVHGKDIEDVRREKKEAAAKRAEARRLLREHRRMNLESALAKLGLSLRSDSELCHLYIMHGERSIFLDTLVDEMAFMKYLYEYTDYPDALEDEVERLQHESGYYYPGIWRDASISVKMKYSRPPTWPWLAEARPFPASDTASC